MYTVSKNNDCAAEQEVQFVDTLAHYTQVEAHGEHVLPAMKYPTKQSLRQDCNDVS